MRVHKLISAVGAAAVSLLLTACGGGGGGSAPPPAAAKNVTVASVGSSDASQPVGVIRSTSGPGTTVAYYANSGQQKPSQALLNRTGGANIRNYYDGAGKLVKAVDQNSGNFMVVRERFDKLGADYLAFDNTGAWLDGYTLYYSGSHWWTARVIGDVGQIGVQLSGIITASGVLKPTSLTYGPETQLGSFVETDLGLPVVARGPFERLFAWFIRTAKAEAATNPVDVFNLYNALAFGLIGNASTGTNPVLSNLALGAGVLQSLRGLSPDVNENPDSVAQATDDIVSGRATHDLDAGADPLASLLGAVQNWVANGIAAVSPTGTVEVASVTGAIAGLTVPTTVADATPAEGSPPPVNAANHTLSGTLVDQTNAVYTLNGTLDSNGAVVATADQGNGTTLTVNGQVDANRVVTGTYTQTDANSVVTASGTISGNATAVGQCETQTQSGGAGTSTYAFDLGADSGQFELFYSMATIPDAMSVVVGGQTVFTTGGLVSGSSTQTITFSGGRTAFVNMSAPNSGTAWSFRIGCAI